MNVWLSASWLVDPCYAVWAQDYHGDRLHNRRLAIMVPMLPAEILPIVVMRGRICKRIMRTTSRIIIATTTTTTAAASAITITITIVSVISISSSSI